MIVRLESANSAPSRIIEMYADEDCIFLCILDRHTIVQWNKNIGVAGHHCLELRFAKLAVEALSDIERNHLFRRAVASIRAAIFAAMSSVHDHGRKSPARVFDRRMPHARASR